MIGSDRVRPGWAAMSFPAFSADYTRNMPTAPEATIAYSCQLVNIAPNPPCEKYVVIPSSGPRSARRPIRRQSRRPPPGGRCCPVCRRPARPAPAAPRGPAPRPAPGSPRCRSADRCTGVPRPTAARWGGEEVEQPEARRAHRQYRAPFPWPHAGLEHPGREDQRERPAPAPGRARRRPAPPAPSGGGLEQESLHRDGKDPEEPDGWLQQAPRSASSSGSLSAGSPCWPCACSTDEVAWRTRQHREKVAEQCVPFPPRARLRSWPRPAGGPHVPGTRNKRGDTAGGCCGRPDAVMALRADGCRALAPSSGIAG